MATNQGMGVRFSQGVPNIMIKLTIITNSNESLDYIRHFMEELASKGHLMAIFYYNEDSWKVKLQFETNEAFISFVDSYYKDIN